MGRKRRNMGYEKYGITRNRYNELRFFCAQYGEWKKRLLEIDSGYQHIETDDPTGDLAVERGELTEKIKIVEETAKEIGGDIAWVLIENICGGCSFTYLNTSKRAPISESSFFRMRRKFFFLLSKRKK